MYHMCTLRIYGFFFARKELKVALYTKRSAFYESIRHNMAI